MVNCSVCGQPIRIIPTGSKFKDAYNKVVLTIGRCCMRCAIAYKEAVKEADSMTYEERAAKTLERMKAQGMSEKDIKQAIEEADKKEAEIIKSQSVVIDEAVKQADAKEKELELNKVIKELNKSNIITHECVEIKVPEIKSETLDKPEEGVSDEMLKKIENKGEEIMVEAYCMKEKTIRKMKDVKEVKMANGRMAQKGVCEKCGTKMFKIGGK